MQQCCLGVPLPSSIPKDGASCTAQEQQGVRITLCPLTEHLQPSPLPKPTLAAFLPCSPSSSSSTQLLLPPTCPTMVLASTSARRGPLSMSAAFRKICARSCTGFRSHSFLAAMAALMALLMSSCGGKGGKAARRRKLSRFLSTTRSQGKARDHPPQAQTTGAITAPNLQLLVWIFSRIPGAWKGSWSLPAHKMHFTC